MAVLRPELSDREFQQMRELIYDRCGITLNETKRGLIPSRLQKVLTERKLENFTEYYQFLLNDKTGEALTELLNNISTNHTFFWRENEHFIHFRDRALPEIKAKIDDRGSNDIRVWSAGCSSGEEPYMLVMLMMEQMGGAYVSYQAGVLGTDISQAMLNYAQKGVYPPERIHNLPPQYKLKYFKAVGNSELAISNIIKREVTFRLLNLMRPNFPFRMPFHAIFCRNVMIYFDAPTRRRLLEKFWASLEPGGYFYIGHSETLRGNDLFEYVKPALYRRR